MDNLLGIGAAAGRQGRGGFRVAAALAAAGLVLAGGGIAFADDIHNNLDSSIDVDAEIMALNVGGVQGAATLALSTTDGDGKNGCNLTGSTTLTLKIESSNSSVATVSPATTTFTSCGFTQPLAVTPVGAGSANVTVSIVSNTTPYSFNLAPAAFRVNVVAPAPANTAPVLSISGVANGASYAKGSVPAATCQVTDTEDGNSSFPATLGVVSGPDGAFGVGTQEAACSYTDGGGITVASKVTYGITDATAPVISYTLNPATPDGANGWYKSAVALDWTVTEGDSPSTLILAGCGDRTVPDDQVSTEYTCAASSSGGAADPVAVSLKKDGTAPDLGFTSNLGVSYYGSTPAVPGCTARDDTSGLAGPCAVSGYSTAVGEHTLTATATDLAGNTATIRQNYEVKAWTVLGFYQPIDMNGILNTVKGGSTVPAKFEVFAGSTEITDPALMKFTMGPVVCAENASTDAIETTAAAGSTAVRFDATAGQFVYNWKTPTGAGNCYQLTMKAADGSSTSAIFKLK
ncbi:PxKF domain-containing protein [Pseudarthrobacter sp. NPDC092419]|uniref:PxKF domain-containing protein n=1 Tax=Pseudarthrobacter sp. NPDC092419 TaxID=3364414 RepID=UPI0038231190